MKKLLLITLVAISACASSIYAAPRQLTKREQARQSLALAVQTSLRDAAVGKQKGQRRGGLVVRVITRQEFAEKYRATFGEEPPTRRMVRFAPELKIGTVAVTTPERRARMSRTWADLRGIKRAELNSRTPLFSIGNA